MTKNDKKFRERTSPENQTLLIAVVHSMQEPWITISRQGQFKTWLKDIEKSEVKVVHFYANPPSRLTNKLDKVNETLRWRRGGLVSRVRNRIFHVLLFPWIHWVPKYRRGVFPGEDSAVAVNIGLIDMYLTTRWKRLSIMKYFLEETNCEYLLMTTSSSYLQPKILLEKLGQIPSREIYAGSLIPLSENSFFCSGAQTILNRLSASHILKQRKLIPVELLDDLGLGIACQKLNITPIELGTLNIGSLDYLNSISNETLVGTHHFRMKSEVNGIRMDVDLFAALDKKLHEAEN